MRKSIITKRIAWRIKINHDDCKMAKSDGIRWVAMFVWSKSHNVSCLNLLKFCQFYKRLFHSWYQFYLGNFLASLLIIKEWLLLMENGFRYCSIQLSVPTEACLKSGKSYPSRRLILAPPHFRHLFLLQKATYLQGYWGYPGAWETLPAMLILACDAWYIFLINLSKLAYWGPFSQPCFVKRG